MPELLDPSEIMFTPFEPKTKNRFIMYIEGVPAYLIKTAGRPQITFEEIELDHINVKRYVKGKGAWDTLEVTLYDPIVPSGAQAVMEWVRLHKESVTGRDGYSDFYKKDITINLFFIKFFENTVPKFVIVSRVLPDLETTIKQALLKLFISLYFKFKLPSKLSKKNTFFLIFFLKNV